MVSTRLAPDLLQPVLLVVRLARLELVLEQRAQVADAAPGRRPRRRRSSDCGLASRPSLRSSEPRSPSRSHRSRTLRRRTASRAATLQLISTAVEPAGAGTGQHVHRDLDVVGPPSRQQPAVDRVRRWGRRPGRAAAGSISLHAPPIQTARLTPPAHGYSQPELPGPREPATGAGADRLAHAAPSSPLAPTTRAAPNVTVVKQARVVNAYGRQPRRWSNDGERGQRGRRSRLDPVAGVQRWRVGVRIPGRAREPLTTPCAATERPSDARTTRKVMALASTAASSAPTHPRRPRRCQLDQYPRPPGLQRHWCSRRLGSTLASC